MPVSFDPNDGPIDGPIDSGHDPHARATGLHVVSRAELHKHSGSAITIGLINNMPDAALIPTERQFTALLEAASDGVLVHLSFYSLPGIPREHTGAQHVENFYSSVDTLWDRHLDGLIVTGREPLAPNLREEPYWQQFTEVIDWSQENTYASVWSCLAAHAAILHTDGIRRVKNSEKHFGIFECARVSDHPLTEGTPASFLLPHSRWNGIQEEELTASGYRVLTRAEGAGVDTFIGPADAKHGKHLSVFFQGHPEYESNTLLLEYRRDVARYLKGETDTYPALPRDYFDPTTIHALAALQERATSQRSEDLLVELSAALRQRPIDNTWQPTAAQLYRNWLRYICEQKNPR